MFHDTDAISIIEENGVKFEPNAEHVERHTPAGKGIGSRINADVNHVSEIATAALTPKIAASITNGEVGFMRHEIAMDAPEGSTDGVIRLHAGNRNQIIESIRDAGTLNMSKPNVILVPSREHMPKAEKIHIIGGGNFNPDPEAETDNPFKNKTGIFTVIAGTMTGPLPSLLSEQEQTNEAAKKEWETLAFLATPEELRYEMNQLAQLLLDSSSAPEPVQAYLAEPANRDALVDSLDKMQKQLLEYEALPHNEKEELARQAVSPVLDHDVEIDD